MELGLGIGIEAPKGQFRCLVVLGIRAWNSGPIPSSPPRAPNLRVAQFRGLELRIAPNWFTSLRSAPLASPRPHRRFLHRRRPPPTSPPPPPAASPPPHLSPPPSSRARARSSQFPNHRCAVSYLLPCPPSSPSSRWVVLVRRRETTSLLLALLQGRRRHGGLRRTHRRRHLPRRPLRRRLAPGRPSPPPPSAASPLASPLRCRLTPGQPSPAPPSAVRPAQRDSTAAMAGRWGRAGERWRERIRRA